MNYEELPIEQQLALVRTEVANSARLQNLIDQALALRNQFSEAEAALDVQAGGLAYQWKDPAGNDVQKGIALSLESLRPWSNATDISTVLVPLRQQIIDTERVISGLAAERAELAAYDGQIPSTPSMVGRWIYAQYRKGAIQDDGGAAMNALAQSFRDATAAITKATPTTTWYGPNAADPVAATPPPGGTSPGANGRPGAPAGGGPSGTFGGLDSGTAALAGSAPYSGSLPASFAASPEGLASSPSVATGLPGTDGFDGSDPGLDGAPVPAPPLPTVPGAPSVPGAPTFPGPPPPWTGVPPPQPLPRVPTVPTGPYIPRSVPDPIPTVPPAPGTLGGRTARGGQGGFRLPASGAAGGVGGLPGFPGGTGAVDAAAGSTQPGRGVFSRTAAAGATASNLPGTAVPGTAATGAATAGAGTAGTGAAGSSVPPPMMPPATQGQSGEKPKPGNAERAKQIRRPPATFPGVPARLRGRVDGSEPGGFGPVAAASQQTQTARRRGREELESETLQLLDEELWDVTPQPQQQPQPNRPTAV